MKELIGKTIENVLKSDDSGYLAFVTTEGETLCWEAVGD